MTYYKGKKYRLRLSGMIIDKGADEGVTVWLDKCVEAITNGISWAPSIHFADRRELSDYCTWAGEVIIGRRVWASLDVVVVAVMSKGPCPSGSYPALANMLCLSTYRLQQNTQFCAFKDEFEFIQENENEPGLEWPEEEPEPE